MADLESCSRIEQRSVIKFLVAEQCKPSANQVKYLEECRLCMKKHVSAKKMFTNGLNYSRKDGKMFSMKAGQEDLQE